MRRVTRSRMRMVGAVVLLAAGCGEPAPPRPWQGFFHPPPKPGQSITGTKQCECRACEPESCCGAEQTELSGPASAECAAPDGDYVFSEECGIRVETCTPRCYSKVWRVPKQESCDRSRPRDCCG